MKHMEQYGFGRNCNVDGSVGAKRSGSWIVLGMEGVDSI